MKRGSCGSVCCRVARADSCEPSKAETRLAAVVCAVGGITELSVLSPVVEGGNKDVGAEVGPEITAAVLDVRTLGTSCCNKPVPLRGGSGGGGQETLGPARVPDAG